MASQDFRDLAAVDRGRVVVARIPPMMATIVPNVVRRIEQDYPTVEVEMQDVLSGEVEELVRIGTSRCVFTTGECVGGKSQIGPAE